MSQAQNFIRNKRNKTAHKMHPTFNHNITTVAKA